MNPNIYICYQQVASIKPVRLYVSDGENGIHMVGCLIPEGRRNEMAERVPILFTTEVILIVVVFDHIL
jgi:hypothetical protein